MSAPVEIEPSVLEYKQRIAFKVKTTAPKFYCVRPNAATVAPGEQIQVQVILLGLTEEPESDYKCRDKFLVITLPCPYDLGESSVADTWSQLEAEFKSHSYSKKIKVKYLTETTAAPVTEAKPETIEAVPSQTNNEPVTIDAVKDAEVEHEKQALNDNEISPITSTNPTNNTTSVTPTAPATEATSVTTDDDTSNVANTNSNDGYPKENNNSEDTTNKMAEKVNTTTTNSSKTDNELLFSVAFFLLLVVILIAWVFR
ncbi:related to Vesicle-associated membrane protein-associated protein SCS2 [Saccharomycodes ludwigii]|uniref:Related to Vesicle-associated membrane protein-associated protein SCS2 n=1 Tax=Saccharomycodes ludwigii TaxID=36035 RepID=A0A376B261_9ASCO|nr:related to Vesicle-associated membrane protein-associated protein SCS2 [Saccharomycodes ludwigii]